MWRATANSETASFCSGMFIYESISQHFLWKKISHNENTRRNDIYFEQEHHPKINISVNTNSCFITMGEPYI